MLREQTDKILIFLALFFYLLVIFYIVKARVGWTLFGWN